MTGYTLPVFAGAAAIAALRHLHGESNCDRVEINLLKPPQTVSIPIEQVARLGENRALAIARSDPGEHLDLTRNTPVWALVERTYDESTIEIRGGEGVGIQLDRQGEAAIYSYARRLLNENLRPLLRSLEGIVVTIILPEGKQLAQRTSNSAFGVVEGLSLLGTTGIVQPLTAPSQLEAYQAELTAKAAQFDSLVFCIGENGLDLAQKLGIAPQRTVKTANWLGSMLVAAATAGVKSILLFGYHGKLIKLAGGIFHTHNHIADGRLEILTAHCARLGMPSDCLNTIFSSKTTEAALQQLKAFDRQHQSNWVEGVYRAIATQIDCRSQGYIRQHTDTEVLVGSILFDRHRQLIVISKNAESIANELC